MAKQPVPKDLGPSGRRLWREITSAYELRADELSILGDACREADLIDRLQAALDSTSELTVKGSMGQTVASPFVTEIRQHRTTKKQLLTALRLPEENASAAAARSEAGRAMNVVRWGARGA